MPCQHLTRIRPCCSRVYGRRANKVLCTYTYYIIYYALLRDKSSPPPFLQHRYGNRHTFAKSTANPMTDIRKSVLFDHCSLPGLLRRSSATAGDVLSPAPPSSSSVTILRSSPPNCLSKLSTRSPIKQRTLICKYCIVSN